MTSEARTPDDIERDIAHEREKLSGSINDLQNKFSVDGIVNDLSDMVRDQAGDLGQAISRTVGRNPAAAALIGVGLAWLFLGQNRNVRDRGPHRSSGRGADARRGGQSSMNWDSGALPQSRPPMPGSSRDNDRFWFRDDTVLKQDRAYRGDGPATQRGTTDGGESDPDGLMDSLRDGAGTVAGAVSDAAGSLRDSVSDLTDRLAHGTEAFSDEARARILSARRAARDARDAAEAAMNRGARAGSNLFEDQPLVVGALAIALGAAIGGILPRTRMEDDALGESSDRLFAEAQAVFQEERAKVRETLGNAAEEARETVRDAGSELLSAGKSVGNETADRLASALTRAVDGNGTPARRQVPGNSGA